MLVGGSASALGKDTHQAASSVACMPSTVKVPDLMYHMIEVLPKDAALPHLWVDPSEFRQTMKLLAEKGWRTLAPRQIAWRVKNCIPIPAKTFSITIDDGVRNGYDKAYPSLQEFGFKAAYAVVVGRIDKFKRAMTWVMLEELQAAGHEIANHTMHHDDVRAEDDEGLYYEIEESNQILWDRLGKRPRTFVYPYGYWDSEAVAQIRASGFWVAYTTAYGCTVSKGSMLTEQRIRVNRSDSPKSVLRKVQACQ